MAVSTRIKTNYPGVYYRMAQRIGAKGQERVYYIVFKKQGKGIEEKVGRQYADAMTPAKAARIRGERIEGRRKSRRQIISEQEVAKKEEQEKWTIGRLWEEYKLSKPDLKGLRHDKGRFRHYVEPYFSQKEPRELLPLDLDRLRLKTLKGKSPQTVKHVLALIRRIVLFGVRKGLCEPLPFIIEMPVVNNQKTEDLSHAQLASLLQAIDDDPNLQAGNIMKMVLYTGMRRGELFRLKWEDIDFERAFITIRSPKGGVDKKIPLSRPAREVLQSHPRTASPYVFPGKYGGKRTDIRWAVTKIKKAAGLPDDFRPLHGLRHTFASMLASSGQVDLYTLQKLLTHKTPAMTQRYAHLRDETLRRASELAGELVQGYGAADHVGKVSKKRGRK